jgi:hypothetical protein
MRCDSWCPTAVSQQHWDQSHGLHLSFSKNTTEQDVNSAVVEGNETILFLISELSGFFLNNLPLPHHLNSIPIREWYKTAYKWV